MMNMKKKIDTKFFNARKNFGEKNIYHTKLLNTGRIKRDRKKDLYKIVETWETAEDYISSQYT